MAKIPNSSGVYNRVNIGLIAIGIACATLVPVNKVNTLLLNSEAGLKALIMPPSNFGFGVKCFS